MTNLRTLQIMRAIAATSVVYYHIKSAPIFGSFGVDIFFVVSGFVMAMVVEGGQRADQFAVHRISRIVPLYWVATSAVLVLAYFTPSLLSSTSANLENYIKSILFIPYFKESGALHPMIAVGWTLNYEMFFYSCVWLAIVLNRKIYVTITVVLIVVFYVLGVLSNNSVVHEFFSNAVVFEFILGMIVFLIYKRMPFLFGGMLLPLVIAMLSFAFLIFSEVNLRAVNRIYIFGFPSTLFLLSVLALENAPAMRNNKLLEIISLMGDASYATYLTHLYVVEGIRKIMYQQYHLIDPYSLSGVLIILCISLMVGQMVYRYVDRPLSSQAKRVLGRRVAQ